MHVILNLAPGWTPTKRLLLCTANRVVSAVYHNRKACRGGPAHVPKSGEGHLVSISSRSFQHQTKVQGLNMLETRLSQKGIDNSYMCIHSEGKRRASKCRRLCTTTTNTERSVWLKFWALRANFSFLPNFVSTLSYVQTYILTTRQPSRLIHVVGGGVAVWPSPRLGPYFAHLLTI